jgi:hypothetical protein
MPDARIDALTGRAGDWTTLHWRGWVPLLVGQQGDVLGRYGLAMYQAQCVERQTAILLATLPNSSFLSAQPEERYRFFEAEFSKTLGLLVKSLCQRVKLPAGLEGRLQKARELRNWLAHRYFWERADAILTSDGRNQMISELQEAADYLDKVDDELTLISVAWSRAVGDVSPHLPQASRSV